MQRCIDLSKKGLRAAMPNPCVGAVIVHNNKIIGEGFTAAFGGPHAEVNAIASVKDPSLLPESTIYVSLEPCSHFGKTPPCCDLIIEKKIPRVVIGMMDPFAAVSGAGILKLIQAGRQVKVGVLEDACYESNKRFFTFHQKNRPYILLKWAQTADQFMAPANKDVQAPVWISNSYSLQRAHQMRAENMAILVGTQTVVDDNPSLTTRDWQGQNPLRIVLDRTGRLTGKLHVLDQSTPTLIITENEELASGENLNYVLLKFDDSFLTNLMQLLYQKNIQSIIVEGGKKTLDLFIQQNLWDEAWVFNSKNKFVEGIPSPTLPTSPCKEEELGDNVLQIYKNTNR